MRSPDIEDAGQEGRYSSDREDTRHPEEDGNARMAQRWHNKSKISFITENIIISPHIFYHRTLVVVASTEPKHALISLPPLYFQPMEAQPCSKCR